MFAYSLFLLGCFTLNLGRKLAVINNKTNTNYLFNQRPAIWAVIGVMLGSLACVFSPASAPTTVSDYIVAMAFCAICSSLIGLLPSWQEVKTFTFSRQ